MERLDALLAEGQVFSDMPALADREAFLYKILALGTLVFVNHSKGTFMAVLVEDFFMRKAFELAFSNAYAFAGAAPCIFEVDDVDFLKPASLNALLSNIAVWNRF